jgi:hypothetical protein
MSSHLLSRFDPLEVARLETEAWKAYYSRKRWHLLFLLLDTLRSQFNLRGITAWRAAYFSTRSALAFQRSRSDDSPQAKEALRYLEKYYEIFDTPSEPAFIPELAAEKELHWWYVHRYPRRYEDSLEQALGGSMAAIYCVPENTLGTYAHYRAQAMHERDTATHVEKRKPKWEEIRKLLEEAYTALEHVVWPK